MQNYISIPTLLVGFNQIPELTEIRNTHSGRTANVIRGELEETGNDRICPVCGKNGHIHGTQETTLRHLPIGLRLNVLRFSKNRYRCPGCGMTWGQEIIFKADRHFITQELHAFTEDLLSYGFTLKAVAEITGLGKNTEKEIDKKRLQDKYTVDGRALKKPEKQARHLAIDEFKLHGGNKYTTVIIDLDTGHILWLAHGKKKECVHAFIDFVGEEWMDGVEAVACDMNSDFQEVFEQRCEHITVVFDHFHIIKNFNDKVVSSVRKEEQARLMKEGNEKAARSLKRSKYVLTSKRETLQKKDKEEAKGKVLQSGSELFHRSEVKRKGGQEELYDSIIRENKLLFTADLVKEQLSDAFKMADEAAMAEAVIEIIDECRATKNRHFIWFSNLLENHFEGIIAHAAYKISSGKIEGINNKIKTIRRTGYGYPDDDYFFLKLFDAESVIHFVDIPSQLDQKKGNNLQLR
ncbi:MAG: ISL3 family transposase [Spirochaetes bacterium]|uniref:ISL3 family transposase n=1 Tax=Candidatus Ornithospirochaeta stercoripullorum TaxID=2840899 RepID=A0A9D9H241_9SPIO|nr:ISL3 family transposase [Candidatus Ornithospirochaeta stercoripullorum]